MPSTLQRNAVIEGDASRHLEGQLAMDYSSESQHPAAEFGDSKLGLRHIVLALVGIAAAYFIVVGIWSTAIALGWYV